LPNRTYPSGLGTLAATHRLKRTHFNEDQRTGVSAGRPRPFRFGLLAESVLSRKAVLDTARRAEDEGFSTFLIRDHFIAERFGHQYAPLTTLATVAATVDYTLGARLATLGRLDLLILDELGYLPMDPRRANLFFQLISRLYEHGSVILTSNKPFEEWGAIFGGDDVIAGAVLDRLLHHCHVIAINGPSYRTKDKRPPKQGST
jgi:hypothetical protein